MSLASRIVPVAILAMGPAIAPPAMAQTPADAAIALMAQDPVVVDIPGAQVQTVQPALQAYLVAVERVQADSVTGNSGALAQDFLAAAQARQTLIAVQLAADQAALPQLDSGSQAALRFRDQMLLMQSVSTTAQQQQLASVEVRNALAGGAVAANVAAAPAPAAGGSVPAATAPELQAYLLAANRLQADQLSGNTGALALDSLAVQEAQQALGNAQLMAGQPPQVASAALAARHALMLATERLNADRTSGNLGALALDGLAVDQASQALAGVQVAAAAAQPAAATPRTAASAQVAARARVQTASPAPAAGVPLGFARRR